MVELHIIEISGRKTSEGASAASPVQQHSHDGNTEGVELVNSQDQKFGPAIKSQSGQRPKSDDPAPANLKNIR